MRRAERANTGSIVAIAVVIAVFAIPLLAILGGSFRDPALSPPRGSTLLPLPPSIEAYRAAFTDVSLGRALLNSFLLAAVSVPVAIWSAATAGFAITRLRHRRVAISLLAVLVVAPTSMLWLPRFLVLDAIGLAGNPVALIAGALLGGGAFGVLLYTLAYERLPEGVLDAARLEEPSLARVWRTVAFPLVRPTTIVVGVLAFLASWGAYLEPLFILRRSDQITAPLALRFLESFGPSRLPTLLAAAVLVSVPVIVAASFALPRAIPEEAA